MNRHTESYRMSSFPRARRALVLLAAAALAACSDSSTGSDTGRLSIKLTDAPGDVRAAVVTIDRVYLQGSDDEGDDGSRVILRDTPVTVDLLELRDTIADLVEDAIVPSGTYHQLRFVISGAYIEVENADGSSSWYATPGYDALPAGVTATAELKTPSWDASGFKVKLPGDRITIEGDQKVLLVDFDVSRSFFRELGNGDWIARPNLEATEFVATASLSTTLDVADTVSLPSINGAAVTLAGFSAVLSDALGGSEVQALTDTDADGVYEADFRFLVPGSYTLDFRAPSDSIVFTTSPARPMAVTVSSGGAATRAATITSARK
jgi:hypothetical protein